MKTSLVFAVSVALLLTAWLSAAEVRTGVAADELDQRIAKLIEQLGDPQYAARERAQQELIKLGFEAFDALSDAENSDDPEIAMQAEYLVRLIRVDWSREGDPRQVQQILKDYEAQSDERRLQRIKQLADLPGDLGLEWLCRLARFERSQVLSKHAALAIMADLATLDDAAWDRRAKIITKSIDRGKRPAVQWLLAYLQARQDPATALVAWTSLTEAEQRTLEQHPQDTENQIVMELLRRKIGLLDRLERSEDVATVVHEMVLCERGDAASLTDLVDWLVKRKAWPAIDEVAARFAASFEIDALLLYTLSEARLAQGNRDQAEQTAEQALKVNSDRPKDHLDVAGRLLERGMTAWAERELRYVIALGPIASPVSITARLNLCDSLHDRLLDREGGQILKEINDAADGDPNVQQQIRTVLQQAEKSPNLLRGRMYFLFACDADSQRDVAKQREFLYKAIEQDSTDVDVLIALYRLPGEEPDRRANTLKLIKLAVDECRTSMDDSPDDAETLYNQLAWLVANTEGDLDEALRLSLKSVELVRSKAVSPADIKRLGGFLDTLSHCYYAKKDYASAVKNQTEAARLDPHSQAIARQLKVFRRALARAQDGGK